MAPHTATDSGSASRRGFLAAAGAAGVSALAGCLGGGGSGGDQLTGSIDISGSSTVYPVSTAMATRFNKDHPEVSISVSRDGTSAGFRNAFIPGESDINDASRPISEGEKRKCEENGFTPIEFRIAQDALTVVVNPANDWVGDCMTLDTLREIWSPDSPPRTWADIDADWPEEEIKLFGAASTSGTFDYFTERVIGEEGKIRSDFEGTEQDNLIAQGVSGNEYALGYLPFAYYDNNPEGIKALKLDAGEGCVRPSLQTARKGAYPLARPLFIYVNSSHLKEEEALQQFVQFYIEHTDDEFVAKDIGYVPAGKDLVQSNLDKLSQRVDV
ncbi:MAG: PstS family phosphate ABC transporter substrate-binding protein [Halobacteriales archaeon]